MTDDTRILRPVDALDIAALAIRVLQLEDDLNEATGGRAGDIALQCMAAKHDLRLVAGFACGCDEGTCPGRLT